MLEQRPDSINRSFRHQQSDELSHQLQPSDFPLVKARPGRQAGMLPSPSAANDTSHTAPKQSPTSARSRSVRRGDRDTRDRVLRGCNDLGMYLTTALDSPLLTRDQERSLAAQIFRYRLAFQRLIVREPAVLDYLIDQLSRWDDDELRIDSLCNLGLSEIAKRKSLEPKLRLNLRLLKRWRKTLDSPRNLSNTQYRRRDVIRLIEDLQLRPRVFESAPFENAKAQELLNQYRLRSQALTRANLRLVVRIAKQICGSSSALMDMIQEGNRGLMHAVTKFDHRCNHRLSTYATPWIKQAILGALPNFLRNIRVPENFRAVSRKLNRQIDDVRKSNFEFRDSESGREICLIANEMNMHPAEFEGHLRIQRDTCSLDQPAGWDTTSGGGQSNLGEVLSDDRLKNPALIAQARERKQLVRSLMEQSLTRREHDVISLRFGFTDGQARSFADVGREMGLTRQRVCQVEKQALEKLGNVTRRLDLVN